MLQGGGGFHLPLGSATAWKQYPHVKGNTMYTTLYKFFRAPRLRNLRRKTWIAHTK